MARDLLIDIRAKDSASPVFQKLGQTAKSATAEIDKGAEQASQELTDLQSTVAKMEAAFEKHARESGQAMTDLRTDVRNVSDAVERSAAEMSRSFESAADRIESSIDDATRATKEAERATTDYSRASGEMLRGLGLLGTAFVMYSNQVRDHERSIIAVERIYGEAASSYIDYANQIQNTSIFSNEEALEAIRLMGTLRAEYDLTDQQVMQLVQTSADLASIHGYELADAAMRVQSAVRGETESIEQLGIALNATAIDREGLMTTVSNAEAAQFRYNALMEQSATSMGAAAEVAQTTTGQVQQLANATQDSVAAFIQWTGPIGQAAAGLSTFGLQAGLAVTGVTQLAQGIKTLSGAGGIVTLATRLAGPAGLVAAAAAAGYALWQLFTDVEDAGVVAFEKATESTDNLSDSLDSLIARITDARIQLNLLGDQETFAGLTADIQRQLDLFEKWGDPSFWENGTPINWVDTGNPDDLAAAQAEWEELIALNQRLGDSTQTMASKVSAAYNQIINNTDPGADAALQTAMNWVDAWQAGEITLVELNDRLNGVIADLPKYKREAIEAAAAAQEHTEAIQAQTVAIREMQQAAAEQPLWNGTDFQATTIPVDFDVGPWLRRFATMRADFSSGIADGMDQLAIDAQIHDVDALAASVVNLTQGTYNYDKTVDSLGDTIDQTTRSSLELADVWSQWTTLANEVGFSIEALEADFEAAMRAANGLNDSLYEIQQRRGTVAVDVAVNTGGAQNALQSGFNAIVGGTNAMGQIAQQTWDWSNSLTDANHGMSQLDNLLLDGAISAKTYRDALDANHQIMLANESVQEDLLRIQAKQLPVMAQLAAEHARYVDELADEDVVTQTVALGYMDQAKATQALSLANLAATASMAGLNGAAESAIVAMAEADPILKAMLVDMGLLSEVDGELKVNFGDVESADEAIKELNGTLETLISVISEAFGIDVNLDDGGAEATLSRILQTLNALDGKSVTTFVTTVGLSSDSLASTGRSFVSRYATGGTHGGNLAVVGEHGPELTWLPNGAQVTNAPASRGPIERLSRRGGGSVSNYFGPVTQTITQQDSSFDRMAHQIAGNRGY